MESESGFTHSALIVDSDDMLLTRLLPALDQSVAEGQQVLMMVGSPMRDLLRDALGSRATSLDWVETPGAHSRPAVSFETFRRYVAGRHVLDRRVHVVAERDTTGERALACLPYEAVSNDALAAYACSVTCLWDMRRQPTAIIDEVRKVHGFELGGAGLLRNPGFVPAGAYLAGLAGVAPQPAPAATLLDRLVLDVHDLVRLREATRTLALSLGFPDDDVTLATNEVVTNGLVHGAPPVRMRCWVGAGGLVIEVEDCGGVPIPPAAGYLPPDVDQFGGRGMWIARQLADIVSTHTAAGRTAVRMSFTA